MRSSNSTDQRPGVASTPIKCVCNEVFGSLQLLRFHKLKCEKHIDHVRAKSLGIKRKAAKENKGVRMSLSQQHYRAHVCRVNRRGNDRAVKRGNPLHTELSIRSKVNTTDPVLPDHDDLIGWEDCDDIDVDEASESSKECEDSDSLSHESDDDKSMDVCEDSHQSSIDDISTRLAAIKLEHSSKWAEFRLGDGYDTNGHYKPFHYQNNLPPYYIAQVSLLKILSQHRGNDLKLFDRIMNWVGHFTDEYPDIWHTRSKHKCHTRQAIIPFLANFFGTKDLLPSKTIATLTDGSKVDIPLFNFKAVFENMMTDTELICEENLIKNNFDPNTWRPLKKYSELAPDSLIDDLTTGYLYEKGIDLYCNEPPPPGIAKILPCPLIFYTDEANYDKKGGCKTGPLSFCPGVLEQEVRTKEWAWRNAAFIPNLGLGHGKYYREYDDEWEVDHHRRRGKKTLTQTRKREMGVQDHQHIYDASLSSFRDYCHRYGGMQMMWKNELCLVKPFVLMLIGDTKEYNTACCHYNSCKVKCPCKDCLCTWNEIATKFPPQCERVTLAHRQKCMQDADYAKQISHHQEDSAWNNLPIADIVHGINGMTPLEWLHLNGQGNFKDGPEVIHNLIGKGETKKSKKEELDLLFRALAQDIRRNSQRDIPIIALRFAIMNLTMVTANERVGNYFMLIVCLVSKRGECIMREALGEHQLNRQKVIDTMTALLSYDAWCRSFGIPKWEIDNAGPAVSQLMQDMIQYLPREVEEGSHGYHKVKFHGLWLILETLKQYGSAKNTSSETGERLHQVAVGMNGDGTQKRPISFTVQVGNREGERTVVNKSFQHVKHKCPPERLYNCVDDAFSLQNSSGCMEKDDLSLSGGYTMHVSAPTGRDQTFDYNIEWNNRERTAKNIKLHPHFLHCLSSWALAQRYSDCYSITGYTELKVTTSQGGTTIYRANECYHGGAWYDWTLVTDPKNSSSEYIGKILGFFRYNTPGFPTYSRVELDEKCPDSISAENDIDNTMYAVVIGSQDTFEGSDLDARIATTFMLESNDEAYIVPVACISKPLAIVKNYGSKTSTGYIHCLPQHKWAGLFTALIKKHMETASASS